MLSSSRTARLLAGSVLVACRKRLPCPARGASSRRPLRRSDAWWLLANGPAKPGWSEGPPRTEAVSLQGNVERHAARSICAPVLVSHGGSSDSSPHDVCRAEAREACPMRADKERTCVMASSPPSRINAFSTLTRSPGIGTTRSLRPLPRSSTCGRGRSNRRSQALTPSASEMRAPVRARNSSSVRSRRPRCSLVWRFDKSVKFGPDEIVRGLGMRSLYWDCEDALRDSERGGIICCHVVKERPYRRQARVACLDRVLPLLLELVQKGENEIPVDILNRQCTRLARPVRRRRGPACATHHDSWRLSRGLRFFA